jgi:O-antigen ligase
MKPLPAILVGTIAIGLAAVISFALAKPLLASMLILVVALPGLLYLVREMPDTIILVALLLCFSPIPMKYANTVIIGFGLFAILADRILRRRTIKFDLVLGLWATLGLITLATLPRWTNVLEGLRGIQNLLLIPVIVYVLIASRIIDERGRTRIIEYYIPIVISYAILQALFQFLITALVSQGNWVSSHFLVDLYWGRSNTLAAIMALFAAYIFGLLQRPSLGALVRLWYITLLAIAIAVIVAIISRGAILALVAGVVFYALLRVVTEKEVSVFKWIIYIGTFTLLLSVTMQSYFFALYQRFFNMKFDMSFFARLYMINDCLVQIRKNLLLGVGPNQYTYKDFFLKLQDPHNIFLRYGVDFGGISILLVLAILIIPFVMIYRIARKGVPEARKIATTLSLVLLVAVINSQWEAAITKYNYGLLFWTIYAIAVTSLATLRSGSGDSGAVQKPLLK